MVSKMCNFSAKKLCQKSGNFASKSKAIGLPFGQKSLLSKMCNFSAKKLCEKSGNFASKSEAIGLPFWPKIQWYQKCAILMPKNCAIKVVILHQKVRL